MSMSSDLVEGDKVVYSNFDSGYPNDRQRAAKHLTKGSVYTVASLTDGGWISSVSFEEVPGVRFNTVLFSKAA